MKDYDANAIRAGGGGVTPSPDAMDHEKNKPPQQGCSDHDG